MTTQHSLNASGIGGFGAVYVLFEILRRHPGVAGTDYGLLVIVCTSLQFLGAIGMYRGSYAAGVVMIGAFVAQRVGMLIMGIELTRWGFVLGLGVLAYLVVGLAQMKRATVEATLSSTDTNA